MPDPIAPWPLVKRGDEIFPVRSLQDLLRARNHPVGVDGIFGPLTEAAVKAFQPVSYTHLTLPTNSRV